MIQSSKRKFYGVTLGAGALTLLLFSWQNFSSSRSRALDARTELDRSSILASQIKFLSRKPALAISQDWQNSELSRWIEQTAAASGISSESLLRISPESPQNIGSSEYRLKPTELELREVSLVSLVRCLYTLSASNSGLIVSALRLTAPRQEETTERWSADVTLSYLIFSPTKGGSAGEQ